MRILGVIAVIIAGFATAPGLAQTPDQRMQVLSALENTLLIERNRLLDLEAALVSPIWIGSGPDDANVVPEAHLRSILQNIIFVVRSLGPDQGRSFFEDWLDNDVPPSVGAVLPLLGTIVTEGRDDMMVEFAIRRLRRDNAAVRAEILRGYDTALQHTRDDFFALMEIRDGQALQPDTGSPPDPYAGVSFVQGFGFVANAGIPDNNRAILDLSLSECFAACVAEQWCETVDFERVENRCFLQDVSAYDTPLRYDYPDDPYDHYVLLDRAQQ